MNIKETRKRLARQLRSLSETKKLSIRQARNLQEAAGILDGVCIWAQDKPGGFYESCRGGWRISDRELKPTYCTDCGRLVNLARKN